MSDIITLQRSFCSKKFIFAINLVKLPVFKAFLAESASEIGWKGDEKED
jgi:hypothetical protein